MKTVVITGANGGMGKATTTLLKEKGYKIFALDKNIDNPIENVEYIVTDVTDIQSIKSAFERIKSQTESIDAILHFAGIYMLDSFIEIDETSLKKIFDVNFFGVCLINKTFLPLLIRGSKILITTSELAPLDPLPFTGIYAVSKSTLDKYAYSLKMELQLLGISVSVLRAGAVMTEMLGVSTSSLDRFCAKTELYTCNAKRFKKIVDSVEAKHISPNKIAVKTDKILKKKKPKFIYNINRNPLLRLLNFMPKRFQFWVIKRILR